MSKIKPPGNKPPGSVNLGTRAAFLALCIIGLSLLLHRVGLIDFQFAIALLAIGVISGLALFLGALVSFLRHSDAAMRARPQRTLWVSGIVPLGVLLLFLFTLRGEREPTIHDITTDTHDVPQFQQAAALRGSESNSLAVKPEVLKQQRAFYQDLDSLTTPLDTATAFQRAHRVAEQLGWEVYNSDPTHGIIEAYDVTLLWGFVDDVVIRIRADDDGGSRLDLRSVSRVGRGDLGANAARIRRFKTQFAESVSTAN